MRLSKLTFLAFYLNGAVDTGKYDDISIDDVQREIVAGTIFDYLGKTLGEDIDLSVLEAPDRAALLTEWQDLEAAVNARRKFGIEHKGLTLLVAYLLEGIQRLNNGRI